MQQLKNQHQINTYKLAVPPDVVQAKDQRLVFLINIFVQNVYSILFIIFI